MRLVWLALVGRLDCAHAGAPSRPREVSAASGHGYALLHEILGQERQVSKLLLIKAERKPLETVIDAIAETCDTAYDRLEDLAAKRPRLDLSDTSLPADEMLAPARLAFVRALWKDLVRLDEDVRALLR